MKNLNWENDSPSIQIKRENDSHKGDFGRVLIVGGQTGMLGAPYLAGMAALRAGAGSVSLVTETDQAWQETVENPELMVSTEDQLDEVFEACTVCALGPGLGQADWSQQIFTKVLQNSKKPMVLDADALNFLAKENHKNQNRVLTPHPGEAAKLLDSTTEAIQGDREKYVLEIQEKYGGVVVLKGSKTLVTDGEEIWVCPYGNPGMSTAGMGDVLTGVIAGFVAQGFSLIDAARLGVLLHAKAGDLAAQNGEAGLIASDLFPFIKKLRG